MIGISAHYLWSEMMCGDAVYHLEAEEGVVLHQPLNPPVMSRLLCPLPWGLIKIVKYGSCINVFIKDKITIRSPVKLMHK